MLSPFKFGRTVTDEAFTNRKDDIKRLSTNLKNYINTILISPRRWGKSSLVKKVISEISTKNFKTVELDLLGVRSEVDFYNLLVTESIKATSTKVDEWIYAGKQFFKQITPKISLGNDPLNEFELSFEWNETDKHYKELLNFPEQLAKKKGIHIVICIDEFQNISTFKDAEILFKRLRSEWQHHQHVTYCLYGSKQHMMTELFKKQSKPFYKFGDVIYLQKIPRLEWISFIKEQFKFTKKHISEDLANKIAFLADDHSYYVQQLAYITWIYTEKSATSEIVQNAVENLINQNAILYSRDIEEISRNQLEFLKAIADGIHLGLSSQQNLKKYNLGTSANVVKIKRALIHKELIDESKTGVDFIDPMFKLWFTKNIL